MIFSDRHIGYIVNLTPREICSRFSESIDPERFSFFNRGGRHFVGQVNERSFSLHVRNKGRDSFTPYLRGTIEPVGHSTRIAATLGVHPAVKIFLLLWLAVVGLFAAIFWAAGLGNAPDSTIYRPAEMFFAGLAFSLAGGLLGKSKENELLGLLDRLFRDSVALPGRDE
jgi:hypothetical protein